MVDQIFFTCMFLLGFGWTFFILLVCIEDKSPSGAVGFALQMTLMLGLFSFAGGAGMDFLFWAIGGKPFDWAQIFAMPFGCVVAPLYAMPSLIAACRRQRNRNAITALNLLAGWTLFGYVGSMVWALWEDKQPVA